MSRPQGRAPDSRGGGGGGEDTLLRSVMGLRAKLPDAAGLGGGGASGDAAAAAALPPPLPPAQMVHMWTAAAPVAGLAWLAARRLAVVTADAAGATLRLYSGPGTCASCLLRECEFQRLRMFCHCCVTRAWSSRAAAACSIDHDVLMAHHSMT